MYGFTVIVKYMDVVTAMDRVAKIDFFSQYNARVKAKEWFNSFEVQSVEVMAKDTGEIIYYHNTKEEYDYMG